MAFVLMLLLIAVFGAVVVGGIGAGLGALIFRRARAAKIAGFVGGLVGFLLVVVFFW